MLSVLGRAMRHIGLPALMAATLLALAVPATSFAGHAIGGPYHLSDLNLPYSERHLHLVDYTDTTWPVTAAAAEWDKSSKVYVVRNSVCPDTNEYCPPVHQVVDPSYWGRAYIGLNSAGTHFTRDTTKFYITVSNDVPSANKRFVICQEIGHLLGLNHRASAVNSCMWQLSPYWPYPDTHDFDAVYGVHDHNDP